MPRVIDSFRGEYFFLSNFYIRPVYYKGHWYKSSEHAFQAQKATNEPDRQYVADANIPADAKRRGREILCRDDWDDVRIPEMGMVVYCKFSQNEWIRNKLCETDDAILIEGNWWHDDFWGMVKDTQGNWVGTNYLGRITTSVRNIFLDTDKLKGG
jgi:ribA/ribD-fused uncharacterized protein